MPREVFAEEIEAFLERLDAVAAARVVANEEGEIERIYITTESTRDDGTIRRAITSALMSRFSLPVEGWRIQIAHLEPADQPEAIPPCHLVRLEETVSETLTKVVVDLRYERDGAQKTITGTAQAPPAMAQRLRTVALATLDALRPLVERSGYRASLEGLTVMPFAGTTVVLAAVQLAAERTSLLQVGAEAVVTSEAEATVAAVVDAVQKPPRPAGAAGKARPDRRRQFEGLRQRYERLIRTSPGAPPMPLEGAPDLHGLEAAEPSEVEQAGSEEEEDRTLRGTAGQVAMPPAATEAGAEVAQPGETTTAVASEDVISDLSEIRPERQGGAAVMREEIRQDGPTVAKTAGAPRLSVEDAFYRRLVASGTPVYIRCRDGYEIPSAIIRDYGTYSLMVEVNGVQELVFKHGIIAIRPYGPLPPDPGTTT